MSEPLEISINGQARTFWEVSSLKELLVQLGLTSESGVRSGIAVERNQRIVPKSEYADTQLESGDVLEIVTLVGGG